jgi:predicted metal-dependent phosphoesterase TrpH
MNKGEMTEQRADLHMHTTHSDGVYSPSELVEKTKLAGLSVISVTDHDNVAAIKEGISAGEKFGVEIIPGVELSTSVDGREVHILGYFIDTENRELLDFLAFLREERLKRAERIVEKLHSLKIPLTMQKVLEKAGEGSVGRPHIANAMVEEGFAPSYQNVFLKYLGFGGSAYVEKSHCSAEETLSIIAKCGGLSFIAHPGNSIPEQVLIRLIKAGVDGIETIHPSHAPDTVVRYRGIVNEYYLLESGGSDFHGGRKNDDAALGQFTLPLTSVETMRRRLFAQEK